MMAENSPQTQFALMRLPQVIAFTFNPPVIVHGIGNPALWGEDA
jgi:hypothetical protein